MVARADVHPFTTTPNGQRYQLGLNLALQGLCAIFSAAGTANDLFNGLTVALVYALEGAATTCLLWSVQILNGVAEGDGVMSADGNASLGAGVNASSTASAEQDRVARVQQALYLVEWSAQLLTGSVFVPMVLTLYDALIVPFALAFITKDEDISYLQISCDLFVAALVLPLQLLKSFGSFNADIADAIDEYGDTLAEIATTSQDVGDDVAPDA